LGITSVKVATVCNFPGGTDPLVDVLSQTAQALADGADEIDVVYPYRALLAGDAESGRELIAACKAICLPGTLLKVILETGELTPALIRQASFDAIASGADFIKTSTGKVRINATTEAVKEMLVVLAQTDRPVGLKPSGGMKVLHDAAAYLWMVERLLGPARTTSRHLRFGASSLLDSILTQVGIYTVKANAGAY
jgi:deoxyribose-phosphate aldolase